MLATAGKDTTVKLWSINGRKIATTKKLNDRNTILSFSPDSKTLATSSQFDIVKLWDIDGKQIGSIDNYGAMSMHFNRDSKTITFVNKDGTIKLWSIKNVLLKNTTCSYRQFTFNAVSLSPDENLLAYNPTEDYYNKNIFPAKLMTVL